MSAPLDRSSFDLQQIKRQAKELLRDFRQGRPEAVARVEAHFPGPDPTTFRLAQAQLVVARSLGFASWSRLREHLGVTRPEKRPRVRPAEMRGRYVHDVDPVDGQQAWELFRAARDGDLTAIGKLLDSDPNLVHAQYWYTQPIHLAAGANRVDALRALFEAGAEPGRTRFAGGWKKLLEHADAMGFSLVRQTVMAVAAERFGFHPDFHRLRDAIVARQEERVVGTLAERPELCGATDIEGNNAIHWAVMTRQPALFARLVAGGADVQHLRGDGQSPGHLLFNGDYEFRVWRELAGVAHADVPTTLAALVEVGYEPDLSVAAAAGDVSTVEALLETDPGLATRLDSGRRNPLTYAVRVGQFEISRLLLERGFNPSRPEEGAPRGMALWEACSAGRSDLVALLLEHGADPNSAPDSSDSCIGIASARAGAEAETIIALLRASGGQTPLWHMSNADLDQAIQERTPITADPWFAEEVLARNDLALATKLLDADPGVVDRLTGGRLRLGSPDVAVTENAVLRLLLERGFDPDRPGWLGKTALHHYAGRGELGNVVLLLEHGSHIDAVEDEVHGTPLAWAAANGHAEVARVLLEHGADPSLPADVPSATPLGRATANGHTELVKLLRAALEA